MNLDLLNSVTARLRESTADLLDLAAEGADEVEHLMRVAEELRSERKRGATLAAEIERLKAELATRPPAPPPIIVTPNDPAPDVEVELVGIGEFRLSVRPTGPGEVRGAYRVWGLGNLAHGEVFVRVQAPVNPNAPAAEDERVVALGRCWSDLPHLAPDLMARLTIRLDGHTVFDADQVLHPHTCPAKRYRQRPFALDLAGLSGTGAAPWYLVEEIRPTETDSRQLASPEKIPYKRFQPPPTGEFTESLAYIGVSYTGGNPALMDGTEGAVLNRLSVLAGGSNDPRFLGAAHDTSMAAGALPIHYWDRATGRPCTPEQTAHLQHPDGKAWLVGDNLLPRLMTTTGVPHPLTDTPHSPELCFLVGHALDDPLLRDFQAALALVPCLTKTAKEGRLLGLAPSGQVRAWVWHFRSVLHLYLMSHGAEREHARAWLERAVHRFVAENATEGGIYYQKSGRFGTVKAKTAHGNNEALQWVRDPAQPCTTLWWLSAFSHVQHEILRAGFDEAEVALLYSLRVQEGWWEAVKPVSRFLAPWGTCAVADSDLWPDHVARTFELMAAPPAAWVRPPTTEWYKAVNRSAALAAHKMGQRWGGELMRFYDDNSAAGWLPPTWALAP
jgi:hypothetical protein